MRKKITWLAMLTALLLTLCACASGGAEAQLKRQLTSGPWLTDLSEGTTAAYTFTKDGSFTCEASIAAGGESGALSRSGSYTVELTQTGAVVHLQYPNVSYVVDILCTESGSGYDMSVAGCAMYQK